MATKTLLIGGSAASADYTVLATYESYLTGLGTWTENETLQVLWNGSASEVTGRLWHGGTQNGFTHIITAGSGASKNDHVSAASNPQRYSRDVGACWSNSGDRCVQNNTGPLVITKLQFQGGGANEVIIAYGSAADFTIQQCIISGNGTRALLWTERGFGVGATNITVENNTFIAAGSTGISFYNNGGTQTINIRNNTLVQTGTSGTTVGITPAFGSFSGELSNNAVAGFNTDCNWTPTNGSNNATDKSSGTSGLPASALQSSLVLATEFENAATDFRVKSTSVKLKNNGKDLTGTVIGDNVGQTRPRGSAFDIGSWEFQEASSFRRPINRVMNGGIPRSASRAGFR